MNLSMEQKHTHIDNKLVVAKEEEETDWEFGISRHKLLCITWINNKVLLCSAGNYIIYAMIIHNGKDYEKECVYIIYN